jgi:hypothetical protein
MDSSIDLSTISFRDDRFLMTEGLNPNNVLEYFYLSQFYACTNGHASINEMIRRGTIAPTSANRIDGDIYMLMSTNTEGEAGVVDQGIFVIQKFKQLSNRPRVPLEIFYIISGTAYLAPGLGKLIEGHLENGIREMDEMIDSISAAFHSRNNSMDTSIS